MAFIPFPLGIKAEMKFLKDGQLVVNVYHFQSANPIAVLSLTALGEILKNAWDGNIKSITVDNMSLESIVLTALESEEDIQVTYTDGLPLQGSSTADDLPSNVAVVISNRTDFTGRSNRGRTYMAGMTAASITGNTVGSGLQTAYLAYHNEIALEVATLEMNFGVASYVSNGVPREEAAFRLYSGFVVENIVDTQRRRLPGAGA